MNFWNFLDSNKGEFRPYFEHENSLTRLAKTQLIAALVITPIYSMIVYSADVPPVYFWLGVSYTIGMISYIVLCGLIPFLRDKLILFFFVHLFGMTVFAFYSLFQNGMTQIEYLCFFALYSLTVFIIQRWYPAVLYNIFVLVLLIYGFEKTPDAEMSSTLAYGLYATLAMSSTVVLFSRDKMINDIEDYSEYLKKIIDNPGSGYILFDFDRTNPILTDYNTAVLKELGLQSKKEHQLKLQFFSHFTAYDLDKIQQLKFGSKYVKRIKTKTAIQNVLEVNIIILRLKTRTYWLAKINNVTEEIKKRQELEINEKKYRNLYYRNKAGVFTMNKESVIINGNTSFFSMLENTINIGEKLFSKERSEDWDFILNTLDKKESVQNYQTQLELENNQQKTLIFSWYLDSQTGLIEGSVIDLTHIQKASQALRQSERKYRSIYEESNDAILILDGDQIVDVNRRAIQLFGKSERKLLQTKLFDLSLDRSSENKEKYNDLRKKLLNIRSIKFDWRFDGNSRVVEGEVSFIEIQLEDRLFYQCVIHDQTELNRTMRSIEQNRKNLENILENTPEGILIVHEGKILYKNSEIKLILGEDIALDALFANDGQQFFNKCMELHKSSGNHQNIQLDLVDKKGELLQVDVSLVSTNYEEKEATLIIIKDISVQNILAKEKLRAELAEETNKHLESEIKERIKAQRLLQEQFLRTKAILDSSSNTFLLTLSLDKNISSFNTHFEKYVLNLTGEPIQEGLKFVDYFVGIFSPVQIRFFGSQFDKVTKGVSQQYEVLLDRKGKNNWLEIYMNPIYDTEGNVAEISLVAHDISEKKSWSNEIVESLKEKEVMLKEIHHRVKNNLQIISSILNLQSSFVSDENTLEILQESRNRIRSMAIIHENLYRTEDFSSINFANYLVNLVTNLIASYRIREVIHLDSDVDEIDLVLDQAIPCGLLVNELITNSLKYAWTDKQEGIIKLKLHQSGSSVTLIIADNGSGLPNNFEDMSCDTLGLQLVVTLVEQLDGELTVNVDSGTEYLIKFDNIKTLTDGEN
ncbi:MAG: PAS domain S-box protein [Crocinitomicaceae bacterium]